MIKLENRLNTTKIQTAPNMIQTLTCNSKRQDKSKIAIIYTQKHVLNMRSPEKTHIQTIQDYTTMRMVRQQGKSERMKLLKHLSL